MEQYYLSEKDRLGLKFSTGSAEEMEHLFGGSIPFLPEENIIKKAKAR